MIRSIVTALFLVLPVQGIANEWPALFDVQNVASGDVLNIREAPSVSSSIIGTLKPDATDIEVIRPNEGETWGLVNSQERAGWVSLAFLSRTLEDWTAPPTDAVLPGIKDFAVTHCFGTEPFWSLKKQRGDERISFSILGHDPLVGALLTRTESRNARNRLTAGALLERQVGASQEEMLATFRGQTCSDGMSDMVYGIDVDIYFTDPETDGGQIPYMLSGCCSIQPLSE